MHICACSWPPREEKSDSQIKHYKRFFFSNNIHGCALCAPSHTLSCNRNKMEYYSQLALAMLLDLGVLFILYKFKQWVYRRCCKFNHRIVTPNKLEIHTSYDHKHDQVKISIKDLQSSEKWANVQITQSQYISFQASKGFNYNK